MVPQLIRRAETLLAHKDASPSAQSAQAYTRAFRWLADCNAEPADSCGCRATMHHRRAALRFVAGRVVAGARRRWLEGRTISDADEQALLWALEQLEPAPLAGRDLPLKAGLTVRRKVPVLVRDLRRHYGAFERAVYADARAPAAVALLFATGCMPAELARGLRVRRGPEPGQIVVRIIGAKCNRDHAQGQPWRDLVLAVPADTLLAAVQAALPASAWRVVRCSRSRLRRALRAAAATALGPRAAHLLSPYACRHMATGWWRAHHDPATVARARGDRSIRTQRAYGGGRLGGPRLLAADAAVAPRVPSHEARRLLNNVPWAAGRPNGTVASAAVDDPESTPAPRLP